MNLNAHFSRHRLPLLALLICWSVSPLLAQSGLSPSEDDLVPFVATSPSLARVQQLYGEPSQKVGADLWIYWNYPTTDPAARQAGFDTLIVHTHGDVARSIKLVRGNEVRALLRQIGRQWGANSFAANLTR